MPGAVVILAPPQVSKVKNLVILDNRTFAEFILERCEGLKVADGILNERAQAMNTRKYKHGLTLVEMLVVVTVIAILATMVIGIASLIDTQSKEKGVKSIFVLMEGALQEYHEFTGSFPQQPEKNFLNAPAHSETLYRELSSIPSSRDILEKISDSLIEIENKYGAAQTPPELYDPWGTALDYKYDILSDNFPELTSAGRDKKFGTADDINNR